MPRRAKPAIITIGDDYTHRVDIESAPGVPIDCSSWTIADPELRQFPSDAEPLATFTVDDTDADTGTFLLELASTVTTDLTPTKPGADAVFDVQATIAGKIRTLFSVPTIITQDVTRG